MDENISRAAGATHGQTLDVADFHKVGEIAGRPVRQRTTVYRVAESDGPMTRPRAVGSESREKFVDLAR